MSPRCWITRRRGYLSNPDSMSTENPSRGKSPDTTAMNSIEIDARDVLAGRWDTIRLGGER